MKHSDMLNLRAHAHLALASQLKAKSLLLENLPIGTRVIKDKLPATVVCYVADDPGCVLVAPDDPSQWKGCVPGGPSGTFLVSLDHIDYECVG